MKQVKEAKGSKQGGEQTYKQSIQCQNLQCFYGTLGPSAHTG